MAIGDSVDDGKCATCKAAHRAAVEDEFICHWCGRAFTVKHSGPWHYCNRCSWILGRCVMCGELLWSQ